MDNIHREQLLDGWKHETGEAQTKVWRDDLTPEEMEYVDQLDNNFVGGVRNTCIANLIQERVRQRYGPTEIRALERIGDHCRFWLRDGTAYVARLTTAGALRLDPIDTTC